MKPVARRQPAVRILFVGETVTPVIPEMVLSVHTTKSLGDPNGVFEILLKPGVLASSTRSNASLRTDSAPLGDWWLSNVRPMTLVHIAFVTPTNVAEVDRVFRAAVDKGTSPHSLVQDPPSEILESVVMTGLVDEVLLESTITRHGPERVVRVTGRDLGKILTEDTQRMVTANSGVVAEVREVDQQGAHGAQTMLLGSPGGDNRHGWNRGLESTRRFLARLMFLDKQNWAQVASFGGQGGPPTHLPLLISQILEDAPGLELILSTGEPLRQYIPAPAVDGLDPFAMFNSWAFQNFAGSAWDALRMALPPVSAECFVDTYGFGARLVARRPPFLRPVMMQGASEVFDVFMSKMDYLDDASRALLKSHFLPTTDEFVSEPLRVSKTAGDGQAYHTVALADVVSTSFRRGDRQALTQYQGISSALAGGEGTTAIPILVDMPAGFRFGSRAMQVYSPWTLHAWVDETKDYKDPTVNSNDPMAVAAEEALRAYYYHRDNCEFLSGTLTVRGRPEIRIGDRIHLPDHDDLIVYVEQVANSLSVGSPYLTQIAFSRGQPKGATKRLATYDEDPPIYV